MNIICGERTIMARVMEKDKALQGVAAQKNVFIGDGGRHDVNLHELRIDQV